MRVRLFVAALALAGALGCGSIEVNLPGINLPDVSGEWLFHQHAVLGPEDECNGTGRLQLAHAGPLVTGRAEYFGFVCPLLPSGTLSDVQLSDTGVSFTVGGCDYSGSFRGAGHDSVAGTFVCQFAVLQPPLFWAARVGPPGALTLDLTAPRTMVIGGTTTVTASLSDVDGRPLLGRSFAWSSSDPAVAGVAGTDPSTLVTGIGTGAATISVTTAGLTATAAFTIAGVSFAQVAAGSGHSCGVATNGAAWCWGENVWGQLGHGNILPFAGPDSVRGGLTFASVSAATNQTCGVTTGGAAYCWGSGFDGQLGNGVADTTRHTVPQAVAGGHTFSSVTASHYFSCGLTTAGAAWCWGRNIEGQLGTGAIDIVSHPTPEPVTGALVFTSLEAGSSFVCGVAGGGGAWCWGDNTYSQLGNGTTTGSASPVPVSGGLSFASLDAGGHACGLTTGGVAWCWGYNNFGQLGKGTFGGTQPVPVRVSGQP